MTLDLKRGKVLLVVLVVLFNFLILIDLNSERAEAIEVTITGGTEDGEVASSDAVYANVLAGSALGTDAVSTEHAVDQTFIAIIPIYVMTIFYITFDTSSIPLNANILESTLYVKTESDSSATDFDIQVYHNTSGAGWWDLESALATTDWITSVTYSGMVEEGSLFNTSAYIDETYFSLVVSNDWINNDGNTRYCLITSMYGTDPVGIDGIFFYTADSSGDEPYMVISYNVPDDASQYPDTVRRFDFKIRQVSERELVVWITESANIPKDRLKFIWNVETGSVYEGEIVEVTLNEDLTWGGTIWINLTIQNKNTSQEIGEKNKKYNSTFVPLWFWILLLATSIFLLTLYLYGGRIKRYLIATKNKTKKKSSRAWRKVKSFFKAVGFVGFLLIGIAFVWLPTGSPDDMVTTLPLIMILGFNLWLIIGIIIILLCLLVLGKKIKKRIKTGRW